jgi:hypothetical protein
VQKTGEGREYGPLILMRKMEHAVPANYGVEELAQVRGPHVADREALAGKTPDGDGYSGGAGIHAGDCELALGEKARVRLAGSAAQIDNENAGC